MSKIESKQKETYMPVPNPKGFHQLPQERYILKIIDDYIGENGPQLKTQCHHWYVYHGLTTNYNQASLCAARTGDLAFLKWCLDEAHKNDYLIKAHKNDCLIRASKGGHLEVVQYLVSQGADITA